MDVSLDNMFTSLFTWLWNELLRKKKSAFMCFLFFLSSFFFFFFFERFCWYMYLGVTEVTTQFNTDGMYNHSIKFIWFWRYLTRGLIWHLSQSSIRPSIYFSLIVKSHSKSISRTNQYWAIRVKFLVKENNWAFEGARSPDQHIMSQTSNPLRHAALKEVLLKILLIFDSTKTYVEG